MQQCLTFQIQKIQSHDAVIQIELLLHVLHASVQPNTLKLTVDFCPDYDYCNIIVQSNDSTKLWKRFAKFVARNTVHFEWMKARWIVVLQGKSGWDDYLLVAHFEPSTRLDPLEKKVDKKNLKQKPP